MSRVPLAALVLVPLLASCGGEEPAVSAGAPPTSAGTAGPAGPAAAARVERSTDPRVVAARAALDEGRLDVAPELVAQAASLAGTEGPLLQARLATLAGDDVAARRHVEEARAMDPADPRVHATAAELAAAGGRLDEAEAAIQRGVRECGASHPELLRARGVHLICTSGLAKEGLDFLQRAVEADPELPFVGRALGQAHLLVAKEHMQAGDVESALAEVDRSLEFDAAEVDARRFRAECLMAMGEWSAGLRVYDELIAQGLPLEAEVAVYQKNAGFWALANARPDWALPYYRRALELGLPREELGTGAAFLAEESTKEVEAASEALAAGDTDTALELLEDALLLDPDSIFAYYAKGRAHDARGEFELAAAAWSRVVSQARGGGIELPEPVHIELARVQALGLGRFAAARRTLEAYLALEPDGRWIDETRTLLEKLPSDEPPPDEESRLELESIEDDGSGG